MGSFAHLSGGWDDLLSASSTKLRSLVISKATKRTILQFFFEGDYDVPGSSSGSEAQRQTNRGKAAGLFSFRVPLLYLLTNETPTLARQLLSDFGFPR